MGRFLPKYTLVNNDQLSPCVPLAASALLTYTHVIYGAVWGVILWENEHTQNIQPVLLKIYLNANKETNIVGKRTFLE